VVLHDEDIRELPDDDPEIASKLKRDNERERKNNERIAEAARSAPVFIAQPSLEAELGIGRNAYDKPSRIAAEVERRSRDELPHCLRDAVRALFAEGG